LCAAAALGSQSRGALVAIAAMACVFWWRSPHKKSIGLLIVLAAVVLLPRMPQHWWDRMHTIGTYSEDASAMGRISAWLVAWYTASNYSVGGGISYQHASQSQPYGTYEQTVRAAHSIYFQILGNHGFVGLFLFLMMWISAFRAAGWLRKHGRDIPEAVWAANLGAMVQVSLTGYAVGGAFLSLPYF